MNKNKYILAISIFLIVGCRVDFDKQDIFVDKLVYLKKDSILFTGNLRVGDNGRNASYYYMKFCKGIPCGEWGEREKNNGAFVAKGTYLAVDKTLSKKTLQMLSNDIIFIDYWQEGGDIATDKYHFTLYILKDKSFFKENKQYKIYIQKLAQSIMNDTKNLKYSYLKIAFVDAVYDWSIDYSEEYNIEREKLINTTAQDK